MFLNTTEELIEDIAGGKMIIIMDDEDRENEGDFVIAAAHCDAEHVNFMAKHGRGLICLTLTEERCRQLNLPLMVGNTGDLHSTNFTVSIEAAEGVTTGISASDRARTIEAAVRSNAAPSDIRQPGHVFPLMAQEGGVLTRAGHTEAGCDFARAANLVPAAVIVEILNDDGTMARRSDLEIIAQKFDLKIGTIADLIRFRAENEKTITRVASTTLNTDLGAFDLVAYEDALHEGLHIALIKGDVKSSEPALVRVQSQSPFYELNAAIEADPSRQLRSILKRICAE
ncbi:MAG: 3,4-dihydroxy-2-butanone-4-phosphate synthase, partial [Pseudomonadota bacterium]|nr:3,4-dihydroxy-2-butanone-4-phosphate synthase [Pseudomonadota bacterium]